MINAIVYSEFMHHNVTQFTQNNTKIPQLDLLHAVIGVCEELLEFSNSTTGNHEIEELGDMLFYHTILTHMLDIPVEDMLSKNSNTQIFDTKDDCINYLLGNIKKYVFHGKPLYKAKLSKALYSVLALCRVDEYDIPTVIQYNKDKLQSRYPNGRADNIFNKLYPININIL